MKAHLQRYRDFFESLNPHELGKIDQLFSEDALFRDPFNRVRGRAAIRRIFEHLLAEHPQARFEVTEIADNGDSCYLRWLFRPDPQRPLCIEGVSRVRFDAQGRACEHLDYWDSNSELFARLPLLGGLVRWLLRRLQTRAADQTSD